MGEGESNTGQSRSPNVIETEVGTSPEAVKAARADIPSGGGAPVDRLPWNVKLADRVAHGTYTANLGGQERCLRPVEVPLSGGITGKFHCSRPCMGIGTSTEKYCPEHDAEAFRPQQTHPPRNQRVINSASIVLTQAERQVTFEREGKKVTVDLEDGNDVGAARAGQKQDIAPARVGHDTSGVKRARTPRGAAAPKRSVSPKGGSIAVRLTIDELKSAEFIDVLRERIVEAINNLPARNVAEMEAVIQTRERVKNELRQEEGK